MLYTIKVNDSIVMVLAIDKADLDALMQKSYGVGIKYSIKASKKL